MKKRIFLVFLLSILFGAVLFAQNFNLKSYNDYDQNFSGVAVAGYLGELDDDELDLLDEKLEMIFSQLNEIQKLTKNNRWLLNQAMNEWEYEVGEVYIAILAESEYADTAIIMFVYIDDDEDFLWRGWTISDDDSDILNEIFSN